MNKCSGYDIGIVSLQRGQDLLPNVGLLSAEKRPCISLVPRTPYSSASSHTLFQLDATSSVADTTASEEWVFESRRVENQSFDRMSFFASRTIERDFHVRGTESGPNDV